MALTKVGKEGITGISNSSDATAITIDSSENVGIGCANGDITSDGNASRTYVTIQGAGNRGRLNLGCTATNGADTATLGFTNGANTVASISSDSDSGSQTAGNISFATAGSVRATLDSSGNILVGTTDAAPRNLSSGTGIRFGNDGSIEAAKEGAAGRFNRTGSDGEVIQIRRDGSTKGTVGINGGNLFIHSANVGLVYQNAQDRILPCTSSGAARDNAIDLGEGGARFDDIFATNGSIQTSDQNEKQDIASLTTAEMTAAKAISKLFKTFKWQDKVAAKGDAARTHTGVIAQEVQTAMTDAGLDASNYAFWCSDTWWEHSVDVAAVEADEEAGIEAQDAYTRIDTYHTADEAPEGATQRTRLGIRYAELMAFVGAATEQRLADIETRLAALEAK